ncbi:MAG: polyprenyl diphosphate synthase [Actinomycetota bacterium]
MSYRSDLDPRHIPRHVAIVMDGNGRWAKQRGLPRTEGHGAGEQALWDTVMGALDVGVRWLTVYAFSTENWRRPPAEVRYLMNFNRGLLQRRRDELNDLGVRVRFAGRLDWRVPRSVVREMETSHELTKDNSKMTLTIAFNYGGRTEVVDAVKQIIREHDKGRLRGERITPESISSRLYHPDMPDPDLLIRTSGEMRISNFMLWEAAYAELWFTPVFWPDFSRENLFEAIRDYQKRDRRFGKVQDE